MIWKSQQMMPNFVPGRREIPMKRTEELTAIIYREGDGYVSFCPELDIASQGETVEQARSNLVEAIELFFETAEASEVRQRLSNEV